MTPAERPQPGARPSGGDDGVDGRGRATGRAGAFRTHGVIELARVSRSISHRHRLSVRAAASHTPQPRSQHLHPRPNDLPRLSRFHNPGGNQTDDAEHHPTSRHLANRIGALAEPTSVLPPGTSPMALNRDGAVPLVRITEPGTDGLVGDAFILRPRTTRRNKTNPDGSCSRHQQNQRDDKYSFSR